MHAAFGPSGIALMPRVRFVVEERLTYDRVRGDWVWQQLGGEFDTPEQAREFERGLHKPVGYTRRRPVVLR